MVCISLVKLAHWGAFDRRGQTKYVCIYVRITGDALAFHRPRLVPLSLVNPHARERISISRYTALTFYFFHQGREIYIELLLGSICSSLCFPLPCAIIVSSSGSLYQRSYYDILEINFFI